MKTETILQVTYINPNYEPGKTVREITENICVVKGKDLDTMVKARGYVRDLMQNKRKFQAGRYEVRAVEVPVFRA